MAPPSGTLSPTLPGSHFSRLTLIALQRDHAPSPSFWYYHPCLGSFWLRRWRSPLFSFCHTIPTTNRHTWSESQIFPQLNPSFSSLSEMVTFNHHLWTCVRQLFTPWGTAWPIPFLVYQTCADHLLFPKARGHPDAYWPSKSNVSAFVEPFQLFKSTKLTPPSPYFLSIPASSSNLRSEARAKRTFSSQTLTVSTTATENMHAPHIRGTHHQPSASLLTNAEHPEVVPTPSRTVTASSALLKIHQMTTQDWASSTS